MNDRKFLKNLIKKIKNGEVDWENYTEYVNEIEDRFGLAYYLYFMEDEHQRTNYLFLKYIYSFFEKDIYDRYLSIHTKKLFIDRNALMEEGLFIWLPNKGEPFVCSFENSIEKNTSSNRLLTIDEQFEILKHVKKYLNK